MISTLLLYLNRNEDTDNLPRERAGVRGVIVEYVTERDTYNWCHFQYRPLRRLREVFRSGLNQEESPFQLLYLISTWYWWWIYLVERTDRRYIEVTQFMSFLSTTTRKINSLTDRTALTFLNLQVRN